MLEYKKVNKIDAHSHFVTGSYLKAMEKYLGGNPDRFPMPEWSAEKHLDFMGRMGISHAVVSYSSPHINFSTPDVNRDLARVGNEEGAALVKAHPGKFSFLASLPLPDVAASLEEVAYSLDHLDTDGFTLPTNTNGIYMGVPEFEPVFAELNRRKALVTFHPNKPGNLPVGVGEKLPIPMMEFVFDTTRLIVDLILKGYPERYPDIKFLIPHCGSMLPYVVDRLDSYKPVLVRIGSVSESFDIHKIFAGFYFDIAGNSAPHQLRDLIDMVDDTHILYASDYPFTPDPVITDQGTKQVNAPYLNDEQRNRIFVTNAHALFPKSRV